MFSPLFVVDVKDEASQWRGHRHVALHLIHVRNTCNKSRNKTECSYCDGFLKGGTHVERLEGLIVRKALRLA